MAKSKGRRLFFISLILLIFGLVMVYSASWPYAVDLGFEPEHFIKRQALAAGLGLVMLFITANIDYNFYKKFALVFYIIALILCLLLFTPLGANYGTFARRWLNIGISFMPSDVMKLASIILMARLLSSRKNKLPVLKDILPVLALMGLSVLPIYFQPNLSTVILILAVLGSMYLVSGMNLKYFLAIIPIGVLVGIGFFSGPSNAYRRERLAAMLNPLKDYLGSGWQLSQSLFALSSGGLFGRGLGRSIQKHLYLTEAHNDFIFAIIGEELGLVGCIFVLVLFTLFIKLGFDIALRTRDKFAKLLAIGISLMIGLQAFFNMGVSIGALPPTGLVLPFISYGGTSLVINLAMVGILLNIAKKNRSIE